jgi:hypothetical protein
MGDWIKSGASAPRSHVECQVRNGPSYKDRRRRVAVVMRCAAIVAALIALPFPEPVVARDNGRFASSSPELKAWFDSLRSGKGPCCSDADGSAVSDVDWESNAGHYRVRLDGNWLDVPDEAVITTPNKVGRTMVWPIRLEFGVLIRCFMPGSMT